MTQNLDDLQLEANIRLLLVSYAKEALNSLWAKDDRLLPITDEYTSKIIKELK